METALKAAQCLKERLMGFVPETAIVLGSGLGKYAEGVQNARIVKYSEIAEMQVPGISQTGAFVAGVRNGKNVIIMQGRRHYYEGYSLNDIALPIRIMRLLGAQKLILTNAAGGVNESYCEGDFMLIQDQINLTGLNVLNGQQALEFGTRFPAMHDLYDNEMLNKAYECANELKIAMHRGVYFYFTGPSYETAAEIRAARLLGADAVGMSTVHEAVCAKQAGMKVLGISCITNMACGITGKALSHAEVEKTADRVKDRFGALIDGFLKI